VRASPPRALETLHDLTRLLRAVLKRSHGGLATLGEELELVECYLAIERARFEERLLRKLPLPPLPPLLLQPLVENAVKHGIAPCAAGRRPSTGRVCRGQRSGHGVCRPGRAEEWRAWPSQRRAPAGGLLRRAGDARPRKRLRARHARDRARAHGGGGPGMSAPLRVVIADDERPARAVLREQLLKL
jgi:hypothetical protein